jgi:hypothetical protein
MKRMILFTGILLMSAFVSIIFAQDECKVLLPRIGVSYTGLCKKGLAEGQGEAIGVDHYKGEFKKGYPDGVGTYKWQTGETYVGEWSKGLRDGEGKYTFKYQDRDSVIAGEWKNDKYMVVKALSPYVIEYRNGIGRITCIRTGDRPYVRYVFSRSDVVSDLTLQGSSGMENINASAYNTFTGYEQVTFPFKGIVKFNAPSALMTSTMACELRLTINQPGAWVVTISF